jgi:hypothetical protein
MNQHDDRAAKAAIFKCRKAKTARSSYPHASQMTHVVGSLIIKLVFVVALFRFLRHWRTGFQTKIPSPDVKLKNTMYPHFLSF